MTVRDAKSTGLAIVSVGFDAETPALVTAAVAFARRTGIDLRFVHVLEATLPEALIVDLPLYNLASTVLVDAQQEMRREMEKEMRDLVATVPNDVRSTWALLSGDAVPAVIHDATAHAANLIMISYSHEGYSRFIPASFSVGLRLMAEAPLPVLAVSAKHALDLSKPKTTILLADDLQPGSDEAARKVFELASVLGNCRVRQVHVHGDFREMLKGSWHDLQERYPELRGAGKSPSELLQAEHDARVAALAMRGGLHRRIAATKGVIVEPDVLTGDVAEVIAGEISEVNPDLVVFGRHRRLKAKPFLLGRVGLRTMIAAQRPILVVPSHDELYAPMPFPCPYE